MSCDLTSRDLPHSRVSAATETIARTLTIADEQVSYYPERSNVHRNPLIDTPARSLGVPKAGISSICGHLAPANQYGILLVWHGPR